MAFKVVNEENIKDFKNFKYSEIKCKCGGKYCNGYPVGFSYELMKQLQQIRDHFGKAVIITSAIRCKQHNKNVQGVEHSKHVEGRAVDFYVKGVSYSTLKKFVNKLPYNQYTYNIDGSVMHHGITPPEETTYNLLRTLKKGSKGVDVLELQKRLNELGYKGKNKKKLAEDKIFGDNVAYAVGCFQKDNKLTIDKVVGKNTAHKLGWTYRGK